MNTLSAQSIVMDKPGLDFREYSHYVIRAGAYNFRGHRHFVTPSDCADFLNGKLSAKTLS